MALPSPTNTELLDLIGVAPTAQQRSVLTELIAALTITSPEGIVKQLSSLFFLEGHSDGIKMLLTVENHKGGFKELSVMLPMLSGKKVYLHLYSMHDECGQTDFMAALACDGRGVVTGVQAPAMRERMLRLFALLPDTVAGDIDE